MKEELIVRLLREKGLGQAALPVASVYGGFLHRMYRVRTEKGTFAVKHLNPDIMKRPGTMGSFRRAESFERKLEDAGIPIIPAVTIDGRKMQECEGAYFYIFRWQNGETSDRRRITAEQCRLTTATKKHRAAAPRGAFWGVLAGSYFSSAL